MNSIQHPKPEDLRINPASQETIASVWTHWGLPIVSVDRDYVPEKVEGLEATATDNRFVGLVTWKRFGSLAEIVTMDALVRSHGYGSQLLIAAENALIQQGVSRIRVITTNDNICALKFYIRHGYRLVRVHLCAMDFVRRIKLDIPSLGIDGIPLMDMWELEKSISELER